jgi:hypothetical protein
MSFDTELILLSRNKLPTYADNIMNDLKQTLLNRACIYLTKLSVTQNCVARMTIVRNSQRKQKEVVVA